MANELTFDGRTDGTPFAVHGEEYELKPRDGTDRQPYRDYHYNNSWDPHGTYTPTDYPFYDKYGVPYRDSGSGTYSYSDFHHNGDLTHYDDPFVINTGKIYGNLDDLRTESPRVQRKLIAAAKALIASTDIDGFRIDTPMQVDLNFFKAWAPEVKRFAAEECNKTNFGMWGEFRTPRIA